MNSCNTHDWSEDSQELVRIFDRLDTQGKIEVLNTAYREKLRCLNQSEANYAAVCWHGVIGDSSVL